MNNRLDQNQQEKVSKRYHDHPLFCACQEAFQNFQAGMHYLMFSPTEVFVESVKVIDDILEEGSDKLDYIHCLWQKLIIRYKLWPLVHQGVVDDEEYEIAVCSVFYTVAVVFSKHSDKYYSELIKDALLSEIDRHVSIVKQEEDHVIVSLSQYAEELELWFNDYAFSDLYLSDDIDDISHDRMPRSSMKVVQKKISAKRRKNSKMIGTDYSKYSFQLNVKDRQLEALYLILSKRDDKGKRFIDGDLMKNNEVKMDFNFDKDTNEEVKNNAINKYLFNQVFTGEETDVRIVWTSNANELWYFINTLYNYMIEIERDGKKIVGRLLEKSRTGPGLFEIVRSRFMNGKKRKVLDERTGIMVETSEPIDYEENAFSKYSKANSPRDTSILDAIISKIAPPRVMSDKEAIDEETDPRQYGIQTPKEPIKLEGDFHDKSHKNKYE